MDLRILIPLILLGVLSLVLLICLIGKNFHKLVHFCMIPEKKSPEKSKMRAESVENMNVNVNNECKKDDQSP